MMVKHSCGGVFINTTQTVKYGRQIFSNVPCHICNKCGAVIPKSTSIEFLDHDLVIMNNTTKEEFQSDRI